VNEADIKDLIGCYRSVFLSNDGEKVLEDLRKFSLIDEQAGSNLTHPECAYRNAMQDMYRYIEAIISED